MKALQILILKLFIVLTTKSYIMPELISQISWLVDSQPLHTNVIITSAVYINTYSIVSSTGWSTKDYSLNGYNLNSSGLVENIIDLLKEDLALLIDNYRELLILLTIIDNNFPKLYFNSEIYTLLKKARGMVAYKWSFEYSLSMGTWSPFQTSKNLFKVDRENLEIKVIEPKITITPIKYDEINNTILINKYSLMEQIPKTKEFTFSITEKSNHDYTTPRFIIIRPKFYIIIYKTATKNLNLLFTFMRNMIIRLKDLYL